MRLSRLKPRLHLSFSGSTESSTTVAAKLPERHERLRSSHWMRDAFEADQKVRRDPRSAELLSQEHGRQALRTGKDDLATPEGEATPVGAAEARRASKNGEDAGPAPWWQQVFNGQSAFEDPGGYSGGNVKNGMIPPDDQR